MEDWCRRLHGLDDAVIAGAAAQHGRDPLTDLGLGRLRVRLEEVERGHQHARRAEPALEPVVLVEGLLQRVEPTIAHEPLDRGDPRAVGLDREHDARARGLTVEQNGARAADAMLAADVRARQSEVLAQEVHQQLARLAAPVARDTVDGQTNDDVLALVGHVIARSLQWSPRTARAAWIRPPLGSHRALWPR